MGIDPRPYRLRGETEETSSQGALTLHGEGLLLRLEDKYFFRNENITCYEFAILVEGEQEAGRYFVLMATDSEDLRETGSVGIEIEQEFYGRGLPAKATRAVLPLLRAHGISSMLITCDEGKQAIRQACEQLSAEYLDTIDSEESKSGKVERYVLNF